MLEHFNSVDESLGDALFGEETNFDELKNLVTGLDDAIQERIIEAVNEALELQKWPQNS